MVIHPIPPVFDENSKVLILGSFPSVKSREEAFFYGHPQNRFWKVLAAVCDSAVPETVEEKRAFLLENKIALWDVIASCDIEGSADSTIRDVTPNDLSVILQKADITKIYLNGRTTEKYFMRYQRKLTNLDAVCLPSTSPANAAWSLERLVNAWACVRENQ